LELDDYEKEAMELAGLVSPTVAKRLADTLPTETDAPSHSDGANRRQRPITRVLDYNRYRWAMLPDLDFGQHKQAVVGAIR